MRRQAVVSVVCAVAMATGSLPSLAQSAGPDESNGPGESSGAGGHAESLSTDPDDETQDELLAGPLVGLLDNLGALVPSAAVGEVVDAAGFRVEAPVHVTVVTTGVDLTALGDAAAAVTVTSRGGADGTDAVGWGTWASSVLLQAAPAAELHVVDVYPDATPNQSALATALASVDPTTTDAVLLAFPPGDVLDPMSRLLGSGRADAVLDAALDTITTLADGSRVVGIPMDDEARAAAEYIGGWSDKRDVRSAARMIDTWEDTTAAIDALVADGIPVVSPAGDLGPTPQSVLGLAGLPGVFAVGAADAAGVVAPSSARGPSLHGTAKPDVVAPVLFAGVLPDASRVADVLDAADLLDAALPVDLAGEVGLRRTNSTSTVAAAAEVVASLALLHRAGVEDRATFAGQLIAAAVPTADRDVLAEGAGVLPALPTPDDLGARPTVSGPLDLGMEPDEAGATWQATVDVAGGFAQLPDVQLDRLVATGVDGRRRSTKVPAGGRPDTGAVVQTGGTSDADVVTVADGRLTVSAVPGDNHWEAGAFCGYSRVDLVGTSNAVDTTVTVGTGPVVVPEDVPTCLVEGMRLDVLNFYIHNDPAQDFTLALLPNLPVGMGLLEGPTMVLPVHPTKERLYSRVSGPDGYTTFGAVVPGFYRMRQFSDYSVDVAEAHPGGEILRDLGSPLTYSQKDALVLPDAVCRVPRDQRGPKPDACHVEQLAPVDVDGEIGYDKTTGRYLVDIAGIGEQGVVLGWAKKMQLTVVS